MEDPVLFGLAVLSLLVTPGPTNTLLATAGAAVGVRRALKLIVAEGTAYLIAILVLRLVVGPLIAGFPTVSMVLRTAVGLYLVWVAWRLWKREGSAAENRPSFITFGHISTQLNPKALVISLSINPIDVPQPSRYLAAFSLLTAATAISWITGGALLGRAAEAVGQMRLVPRVGATAMGVFAFLLVAWPLLR